MARGQKTAEIKCLYYITHVDNIRSILQHGILSHGQVEAQSLQYRAIYDHDIVSNRKVKKSPDGRSLWEFANVYFQPRNPMLYRVAQGNRVKEIAVLEISASVLNLPGVFVTDGNAASDATEFYDHQKGLEAISKNWSVIKNEWWNSVDGSKRKIMAECLVPGRIPPALVQTIFVDSHPVADRLRAQLPAEGPPVVPEPRMFFIPTWRRRVSPHIVLAHGDMFFSSMQTLTVSVNTVGIMGKGLASRAKYQFPDVYVVYQDACRKKRLKMGKPFIYKREGSVDEDLVDEPEPGAHRNGTKWFLLFATKDHWRDDSDLDGIGQGLRWVAGNYAAEGITSLAMPALGCGLGNLDWRDVGPLMCRTLATMSIPVTIYLPREREIADDLLEPGFLFGK